MTFYRLAAGLAMLFLAPASARAEWWEARTEHFIVYSQSTAKDARAYAERLERFDHALRSLQKIESDEALSDSRRLTVFRFGNIDAIGQLYGSAGVAGFYIPRASGPVAFAPAKEAAATRSLYKEAELDAQTVFFHEYAHHFMFRHFTATYPSWYVEAFAELNSTIKLNDDGSFELGAPPQSRASALMGDGLNYSIKRMLLSGNKPDYEDFYARYTYGWLLTHYLTFGGTRTGQLQNYLRLINGGADATTAAKQAFGDLDKLETEVRTYRAKNRYPGAVVRPAKLAAPPIVLRRLSPDEEAIMRVRTRSESGVSKKNAKDVAGDARAIAARYPASLPVNLALMEAEYDAGHLAEAERAANNALRIEPKSVKAMLYLGMTHLKRAKTDPTQYAEARIWLGRANRADGGHPSPLLHFYETYRQAGVAPSKLAIAGLERAFELAPYDDDLRLLVVRQLLIEREGQIARQLLLPLALSPHESKLAKALNEVAKLIEANKIDEALVKLDTRLAENEKDKEKGD